ncbi:FAD-linked oxidase C-terminal domain-containing protein [Thermostilla marina]
MVGHAGIRTDPAELVVYDCDAYTLAKAVPWAAIFPENTSQIAQIVAICRDEKVPIFSRGAGTGLAGGSTALQGGVILSLTRMKRIRSIDLANRRMLVEAGVLNRRLAEVLQGSGLHYAPDPSSQNACTIGGNIATNAGGPHTLKYGVTVNHVLGLEFVDGTGEIHQIGPEDDPALPDLKGLIVGSEGTLGIVTAAWLRLMPDPQAWRTLRAIFPSLEAACGAVGEIIGAGIVPAAMEVMDRGILEAVEEAFQFGFPPEAQSVLVIELDGPEAILSEEAAAVASICRKHEAAEILHAKDEAERLLLWKCRKSAVGAVGRISPSYFIQDGVVPRTRLPELVRRVEQIAREWEIRIVNVAHAGDGNVHPILLFDEHDPEQTRRAEQAGRAILRACIELGGSITAEHGVGVEKIDLMPELFSAEELDTMRRLKEVFDPDGILSPGKLIPAASPAT